MIIGQIFLNRNDRFQVDDTELTSGDVLDVLIVDGTDNKEKWVSTSVECNAGKYYLTNLLGFEPIGLFAKVNR